MHPIFVFSAFSLHHKNIILTLQANQTKRSLIARLLSIFITQCLTYPLDIWHFREQVNLLYERPARKSLPMSWYLAFGPVHSNPVAIALTVTHRFLPAMAYVILEYSLCSFYSWDWTHWGMHTNAPGATAPPHHPSVLSSTSPSSFLKIVFGALVSDLYPCLGLSWHSRYSIAYETYQLGKDEASAKVSFSDAAREWYGHQERRKLNGGRRIGAGESALTLPQETIPQRKSFFSALYPSLAVMDNYLADCFLYILPFVTTRHSILALLKIFISRFEETYERNKTLQFVCDFAASLASYAIIYPAHCFMSRYTCASMTGFQSQYDHVDLALMHSKPESSLYTGLWSGMLTFSVQYLLSEGLQRVLMRHLPQTAG